MGTRTTDCRKFTPNIFNKSKCSHCFRQREEHSAAALECNRASRKISKCGYLFVAPDWDFSNPLHRTKRWQRRWFVLYDDGELSYSVDEHPETIPQACIDMTQVLEVATAEDVTGHTNSIAITSQDRVTFVKGTCPEEAKWWLNVLQAFPRSKGRHKRNATFPGGQTSTLMQSKYPTNSRHRHNSYHKDLISTSNILEGLVDVKSKIWNSDEPGSSATANISTKSDENNKNFGNEITNEGWGSVTTDENKCVESIITTEQNAPKIAQPENQWRCPSSKGVSLTQNSNTAHMSCANNNDETDFRSTLINKQDFPKALIVRPKSLALAPNTAPAIVSAIVKKILPVDRNEETTCIKQKISSQNMETKQKSSDKHAHERGDPDGGCTLDDLSANYLSKTAELVVDVTTDTSSSKKGWLMKQDVKSGEWVKHWFVLQGAALFYYRDQLASVLDGVLDTNSLTSVKEITVPCHYAFQLTTWDDRQIVLATLSANCRNNWINALLSAANIHKQTETNTQNEMSSGTIVKENISDDLKSEMEKGFIKAQIAKQLTVNKLSVREQLMSDSVSSCSKVFMNTVNPISSKTVLMSSDEEYRTASEGGRRDSVDWGSPLSPSPPLTKTLLRPRDRKGVRSSSNTRLHKRSRSSPPSSRRSTMDSLGSDDLDLLSVQEESSVERHLQVRLDVAEKERDALRNEAEERETRMSELLSTLERTELELTSRIREVEEVRGKLSGQLLEANGKAEKVIEKLTYELQDSQENIRRLENKLALSMDENHHLNKKIDRVEIANNQAICDITQTKIKRVSSFSDLTNIKEVDPFSLDRDGLADEYNELHLRFEKAVNEIRAMKKELRESQKSFDSLELSYAALKQDMEQKRNDDKLQIKLLAERIQDLTFKYSGSERQVRMLKQKLSKSERRKSLSLKGKEILEEKVNELENKMDLLEKSSGEHKISEHVSGCSKLSKRNNTQSRRKSLESCNNSSSDSLNLLVRLNTLEKRIDNVTTFCTIKTGPDPSPNVSEFIFEKFKCLEGALVASKDKIEQGLLHLQTFKSARMRRSVSPITDRKDSFKQIERCLQEVAKLLRESLETNMSHDTSSFIMLPESHPTKSALIQLENQLKIKLNDLLKERRILRERKELSFQKNLELTAERIAFETVCFGKLRDIITKAEDPLISDDNKTKTEIAETTQLIGALRAKLGGKCALKPKSNLDLLAAVLARRLALSLSGKAIRPTKMPPANPKVITELLTQQNELNIIIKRYKSNALESLGQGLASETLNYINPNDAVQVVVQEAWRQAQEVVNMELVQSEIAHVMLRNAQRFENSLSTSIGYALTSEERTSFENFADAVHETLRKEMDNVIQEITQFYEESLNNIKGGQWRLHLEQERKASESRQLLSEFADIMAHKAMIDARIAVLQGNCAPQDYANEMIQDECLISVQKYETLFEELANDLQIKNAGDILIEADFKLMYKNFIHEFTNSESEMKQVLLALNKLDEAINVLQLTVNCSVEKASEEREIRSLKDMHDKCFVLCAHIECISNYLKSGKNACTHCQKMQDSICNLATQHEIEIRNLQRAHESDVKALRLQIEQHLKSIKILECERTSILEQLKLQATLIENHERELATISRNLKEKEEECYRKDARNIQLTDQLQREQNKCKRIVDENFAFKNKSLQQNEEYAALLQERDYVQAELNKERERVRKLEKRLEMLETEHTKQLECLQEAYKEQIMAHCVDLSGVSEGESFHQRYQSEIEQLRTLCEKGLSAMESSHRRIVSDLEEKHRQEIERLLIEKEQALAEETQATLAALDAMRKAHQSEVQREVARFKQDFIRQFQKGNNLTVPAKEREEELDELRQEILSFSEKYSVKCVENAALEEKLRVTNQKLKRLQHMQQLDLRNKQFKAHLASDTSDMKFVQGLSSKEDTDYADSEV